MLRSRLTPLHFMVYVLLAGRVCVSAQRPGSCIRNGNEVDCIVDESQCSAHVIVSSATGEDCRPMVENQLTLNSMVCNRLVDVLESIALDHTTSRSCIVVDIYPTNSGAPHIVPFLPPGDQKRIISANLLLRGVGGEGDGRSKRQSGGRPGSTSTAPPLSTPPPATTGQPPLVCVANGRPHGTARIHELMCVGVY